MKEHIETARRQLGELGAMAQKTEAAEREILERAEKRLEEVMAGLKRLNRIAMTSDPDAQREYVELVQERGQLETVISKAREVLTPTT